jgi:hypothetical protein
VGKGDINLKASCAILGWLPSSGRAGLGTPSLLHTAYIVGHQSRGNKRWSSPIGDTFCNGFVWKDNKAQSW